MTKHNDYHIRQMAENLHKWQAFQTQVESYLPSEYDLDCIQEELDKRNKKIKELEKATVEA